MPRRKGHSIPSYRKHKHNGQACVVLNGQWIYLGKHGTKASREKYDRVIGEWAAAGRQLPSKCKNDSETTIAEICLAYWKFAQGYYCKNGQPTGQLNLVRLALRALREMYGDTPANDFGPLALHALQQKMISDGASRTYINDHTGRIKRLFKWAKSQEFTSAYDKIRDVQWLRKGRSAARESDPVLPVADEVVNATLPHLSPVVRDMVKIQRLTGCRPGEVCLMRPGDIDRSGSVWRYTPERHKEEHHQKHRVIFVGPKAQAVLRPYLLRAETDYCFSPADSESKRREAAHEARKTPLSCGNRPGVIHRRYGARYNTNSYRTAVQRAAKRAKVARWSPNQLRHAAGTHIRQEFGVEAAQVVLGHSSVQTTQIYAERDFGKAKDIAAKIG